MAACPAPLSPARRRRFVLTDRRVEANRRNAARSTGPRTAAGKSRVARNAIKHGFFVAPYRWTPEQQRDFRSTYNGLRDDFRPDGIGEESCVWTVAHSYVQMASLLRYESLAAYEYHQQCDRELDAEIAAATPDKAAQLREHREELRRAGLWGPTIPGPREANAICRYLGRLDRTIRCATSELEGLKAFRTGGRFGRSKLQKQTHCSAAPNHGPEAWREASAQRFDSRSSVGIECEKTNPFVGIADKCPAPLRQRTSAANDADIEIEETKPLSPMFPGNRRARRRAAALARRRM